MAKSSATRRSGFSNGCAMSMGSVGGYTIVKDYVRLRKLSRREMFMPLEHPRGDAQADFGEAAVVIAGVERKAKTSGDLNAAVGKYRSALELDPAHNGIRVNVAVELLRRGQWKEGLDLMREAMRRDPNNATQSSTRRCAGAGTGGVGRQGKDA